MDSTRIAELLQPFLKKPLTQGQLDNISTYIDIMLKWNSRVNLTAIRDPDQIVRRHFGESLFAARQILHADNSCRVIDVGSGAGFPGLAFKIWAPGIALTLIESNQKKATFLKEAARALEFSGVTVVNDRAENYAGPAGDVVTLRAVEKFAEALPVASGLLKPDGQLALLIGEAQSEVAKKAVKDCEWARPLHIPLSDRRILVVGRNSG